MLRNVTLRSVLIVLDILAVLAFGIFLWPVPQIVQAGNNAGSAGIVKPIVEELQNPSTEEPTQLQPLPAGVNIEKMSKCYDANKVGSWKDDKKPFNGTQLICGADGYWDITQLFYNGVEYQVPVLENAVEEPSVASTLPEVTTYVPTENAVPLVNKGEVIGFFYVLNKKGPVDVVYPSQSTVLVTLGNAWVSPKPAMEIVMTSDGTQGNIFVDICETAEDCKLTVSEYAVGHVGVTIVFAGKEKPAETLAGAINNMFKASNCGGSGCLEVIVHNDKNDPTVSHFDKKVVAADVANLLTVPIEPFVSVAIVGEPPANAKVIKIAQSVVGHAYTCSGECSVSVPEGTGGTVACFPEGGTADGTVVISGEILAWNGADNDGGTPEDLNKTVLLNGNNIQITMIYLADLEPFMNVACGQ